MFQRALTGTMTKHEISKGRCDSLLLLTSKKAEEACIPQADMDQQKY